ncbi:acyltransferase [Mucilaginibacter sp. SP1R1]|uniref:acyltransferase n=1 Tax=Mucilaginibacter sp. SP1R1 TaxID=2723091 RepID=UPI00160E94B9|nr:acyltransferase [Mucilaginibacter sp. SP1R1]MBB6149851.1 acetyltransferase-like isoleucine patch superfamily enzyme [Mucilaginibacter sp. SP1R1]
MIKALKFLKRINLKSIIFNFRYFPFKTAIKFPVLISNNVFLYKTKGRVIINGPIKTALVQIGYGAIGIADFKRSRAVWEVYGDVVFNGRAFIMHGCKINVAQSAQLIFGDDFNMSTECQLVAAKKIEIGNHSGISWESLVMDTDFHHIADANGEVFNHPKEVIIGDNVWVGCKCTILKGAVIPSGSIVAANSMVTKKLTGENSIFGGNPMRVLKTDIKWWY